MRRFNTLMIAGSSHFSGSFNYLLGFYRKFLQVHSRIIPTFVVRQKTDVLSDQLDVISTMDSYEKRTNLDLVSE